MPILRKSNYSVYKRKLLTFLTLPTIYWTLHGWILCCHVIFNLLKSFWPRMSSLSKLWLKVGSLRSSISEIFGHIQKTLTIDSLLGTFFLLNLRGFDTLSLLYDSFGGHHDSALYQKIETYRKALLIAQAKSGMFWDISEGNDLL